MIPLAKRSLARMGIANPDGGPPSRAGANDASLQQQVLIKQLFTVSTTHL